MRNILLPLKEMLESGYTLILSSSHSANYYRDAIAKEFSIAIDNTKIVAVEDIKSKILNIDSKSKIVNNYIKRIFATEFIKENNTLKDLYLEATPENSKITLVKDMLEEASRVLNAKNYDKEFYKNFSETSPLLLEDLQYINDTYKNYLMKHNLVDKSYSTPNVLDGKYCLVFSNTIIDKSYLEYYIPGLVLHELKEEGINKIYQYDNSNIEIDTSVCNIEEKLKRNILPREIVISLADWSYYPYLEKICNQKNIELNPIKGRAINSYNTYRMFEHFNRLYISEFLFDDLKAFILDDAVCLKDKEGYISFLQDCCAKHKQFGNLKVKTKDDYIQENYNVLNDIDKYLILRDCIVELNNVVESSKLLPAINALKNELLKTNLYNIEDNIDVVETKVFKYILKEVDEFTKSLDLVGYKGSKPLYPMFLDEVKDKNYAMNTKEGITVLPYPLANTFFNSYHYVLGLGSDKAMQLHYKKFNLIDNNSSDRVLTNSMLKQLMYSKNTIVSFSTKTYGKDNIAPAYFLRKKCIEKLEGLDYIPNTYDNEYLLLSGLYDAQYTTYSKHLEAIKKYKERNIKKRNQDFINIKGLPIESNGKFSISPSTLDKYLKDPFAYYVERCLKAEELRFNNLDVDNMNMGTAIHNAFERFNRNYVKGGTNQELIKDFSNWYESLDEKPTKFESPRAQLQLDIYNIMFKGISAVNKNDFALYRLPRYIARRFYLRFEEAIMVYFEGLALSENVGEFLDNEKSKLEERTALIEEEVEADYKGIEKLRIKGRVDYAIKDESGRYYIIDYKSGDAPKVSPKAEKNNEWQLHIYKKIVEIVKKCEVAKGYYFSLKKDGFVEIFPKSKQKKGLSVEKEYDETFDEQLEIFLEELLDVFETKSLNNDRCKTTYLSRYNNISRKGYGNE